MENWTGLSKASILNFSAAMQKMALTVAEAKLAIDNFSNIFNNILKDEKLKKLNTLKSRLITLESRQTECNNIKKKIKRKIRYLENQLNNINQFLC